MWKNSFKLLLVCGVLNLIVMASGCAPQILGARENVSSPDPVGSGHWAFILEAASNLIRPFEVDPAGGQITQRPVPAIPSLGGLNALVAHPTANWIYSASLGGVNQIAQYSVNNSTGQAKLISTAATSGGPTAIIIDVTGKWIYTTQQNSTIAEYAIDQSTGNLSFVASFSTGANPTSLAIHPSNQWIYSTSNNTSVVNQFAVNQTTGQLSNLSTFSIASGSHPRGIACDPSGQWVYVANSFVDTISMYSVNSSTGQLSALSTPTVASAAFPNTVNVDPSGRWVYVSAQTAEVINQYSINPSTGILSNVGGPLLPPGARQFRLASIPRAVGLMWSIIMTVPSLNMHQTQELANSRA